MIELKPCPFCGGKATGLMERRGVVLLFTAGCQNKECDVRPETRLFMTMEKALDTWNHREGDQDAGET